MRDDVFYEDDGEEECGELGYDFHLLHPCTDIFPAGDKMRTYELCLTHVEGGTKGRYFCRYRGKSSFDAMKMGGHLEPYFRIWVQEKGAPATRMKEVQEEIDLGGNVREQRFNRWEDEPPIDPISRSPLLSKVTAELIKVLGVIPVRDKASAITSVKGYVTTLDLTLKFEPTNIQEKVKRIKMMIGNNVPNKMHAYTTTYIGITKLPITMHPGISFRIVTIVPPRMAVPGQNVQAQEMMVW
jgi:hypothetical protein